MVEESEYEDHNMTLKITPEDFASDGYLDSKEVNYEERQPLMTQTMKLQKTRSGL